MRTAIHAVTAPETRVDDAAPILTLTKVRGASQATQQYTYDPAVIDKAVQLGDMKQMSVLLRDTYWTRGILSKISKRSILCISTLKQTTL